MENTKIETARGGGAAALYGILGWPVEHSLSPALHEAAFDALGMNARYVPFPTRPERLEAAVRGLAALGVKGVNVTVPHKTAVMPMLDALTDSARRIGAVNTIVVGEDGKLEGHNTDGAGFMKMLESNNIDPANRRIAVLGAGGAARAVVDALACAGPASIHILNRTFEKAESLAGDFDCDGAIVRAVDFSLAEIDIVIHDADIIINTTSLGLHGGDASPIGERRIRPGAWCVDLIYNPPLTAFLKSAELAGARTLNGYGMLVHQAAEAFRIWTGRTPPVDAMWNAGLSALR